MSEPVPAQPRRYGVFRYDPLGMYLERDALRVYARRGDADRAADKGFPDLVVRAL